MLIEYVIKKKLKLAGKMLVGSDGGNDIDNYNVKKKVLSQTTISTQKKNQMGKRESNWPRWIFKSICWYGCRNRC